MEQFINWIESNGFKFEDYSKAIENYLIFKSNSITTNLRGHRSGIIYFFRINGIFLSIEDSKNIKDLSTSQQVKFI
jgi:hypothetical protein